MSEASSDREVQLIERIHDLSVLLASGYEAELVPAERLEDGTIRIGWFNYAPQIWDGIEAAMDLLGVDYDYLRQIEAVRERRIPTASPSDLSTWFTWMSRGERFCDGFLYGNISNGELTAITKRLEALIASGDVTYPPLVSPEA